MKTRNLFYGLFLAATMAGATPSNPPPKFDEVYQLLRQNLGGVNQGELDRAAVKGLIEQFPAQVMLEGDDANASAPAAGEALGKTTVYDGAYACFQIKSVAGPLAERLRAACAELAGKSKLRGIILDLRFAGGTDYAAAVATADCFLNTDQKLLDWGDGAGSATRKTNVIALPVAILVNAQTTGAAEALAAALREADTGLIIGSVTAGQANLFKEFTLSNGDKLRVATSQIKLGDGTPLLHGLKPDIEVSATLDDERAYQDDPYKILHPPFKNDAAANLTMTNQPPRHRTNEAELVRQRRSDAADDETDADAAPAPAETTAPPVIADAALAHALDLLKGIAVLQQSHPG